MPYFTIINLLQNSRRKQACRACVVSDKSESGRNCGNGKSRLALAALALLGGLAGCSRQVPGANIDTDTKTYKYIHAATIQPMQNALPGVGSVIDVTTGKPFALPPSSAPTLSANLSTPIAVTSEMVLDDPNGVSDSGEKAGSWVGTLDIYWKLNWMRQELLEGNVPRALPDVVARQQRHLTRLLHESRPLAPDPGHYIPFGVTIPQTLTYADDALKQMAVGLEHLQQQNLLEAAGIRALSVAWNANETEVSRQFERQGLIKAQRPAANPEHNEEDTATLTTRRSRMPQTTPITRQDEAVAIALKYVRVYHASPEEVARREFEGALRDIVRMRDLLHYEFHKPSVPGNSAMIPGTLHQEAGSPPPTGAPKPIKDTSDPFRSSADAQQTNIDPFHVSEESPSQR